MLGNISTFYPCAISMLLSYTTCPSSFFPELATEPDRWFAKLESFVETEPDLDLSSVYLGKD